MKALLLTFVSCSLISLRAQYIGSDHPVISVDFEYEHVVERSGNSMTINYDQSDELFWGVNYQRALFPIHKGYDTIGGQNIVYASYTLDSLIKSDNTYSVAFENMTNLVLDSMDFEVGHVKYSGTNDTIFFTLVELDADKFPGGPVVLKDTIVLNVALSPGNNLTNTITLRWKPDFTMGSLPIGLKIEFAGSLQDTLALMTGYGIFPAPNSCSGIPRDKARKSLFYPNSYAYWSNYHLLLPTNVQGDLFYDCNANVLQDTSDSESYVQNWAITSYVSAPSIGIEEEEMIQLTIYPNPAGNIVQIKSVSPMDMVRIYNGSGILLKMVKNPALIDVTELNNGIYIFAFEYENKTVHKKVVIQH